MGGQVPISFDTVPALTSQGGDCLPCSTLRAALANCGPCPEGPSSPSPQQPALQPTPLTPQQQMAQAQLLDRLADCPNGLIMDDTGDNCRPLTPSEQQVAQRALQQPNLSTGDRQRLQNALQGPQCPAGEHPQPCGTGEGVDPQSGCCQVAAIETCIVCPGGLPEWEAGLAGQPNKCYIDHQAFLPLGSPLPAPQPTAT